MLVGPVSRRTVEGVVLLARVMVVAGMKMITLEDLTNKAFTGEVVWGVEAVALVVNEAMVWIEIDGLAE
jgi:hypothetical protein